MEKQYTKEQMVFIDSQAQKAAAAVKDLIGALGLLEPGGKVPIGSDLQVVDVYYTLMNISHATIDFSTMRTNSHINLISN